MDHQPHKLDFSHCPTILDDSDSDRKILAKLLSHERTTLDHVPENGPRRPQASPFDTVRSNRHGTKPSTLKTVGPEWHYIPLVVQAGYDRICTVIKC